MGGQHLAGTSREYPLVWQNFINSTASVNYSNAHPTMNFSLQLLVYLWCIFLC